MVWPGPVLVILPCPVATGEPGEDGVLLDGVGAGVELAAGALTTPCDGELLGFAPELDLVLLFDLAVGGVGLAG